MCTDLILTPSRGKKTRPMQIDKINKVIFFKDTFYCTKVNPHTSSDTKTYF